jgi:hypothetical protein
MTPGPKSAVKQSVSAGGRAIMIITSKLAAASLLIVGAGIPAAWADSVRVAPERVQAGKTIWIVAKGSPEVNVQFKIDSGSECGALNPADVPTNQQGEAKSVFTASDPPSDCEATIKTVISRGKESQISDPGNATITRKITVVPATPIAVASMDVTAAITIILIASFAIDRLVTLLMFFSPFAKRRAQLDSELVKKRERLTYVALAGVFGLLLGYFGDIRLLAGLGFSTNVALNSIVTAFILIAGSDSISALLKKMGGNAIGESEPKPLVVRGDLTLKRPERVRAAAEGGSGSGTGEG